MWILDKKTNQRNPFLPNKHKAVLKLKCLLTDLIYMEKKKINARLTPSTPPDSHLVAHRTDADCQWYYVSLWSWLAGCLFIFTKVSFAMEKKESADFIFISIQKFHHRAFVNGYPCQSKTNPDLSYKHSDLGFFSWESLKSLVFMLHWNRNKFWSFASFHRMDLASGHCYCLLFASVWPGQLTSVISSRVVKSLFMVRPIQFCFLYWDTKFKCQAGSFVQHSVLL